MFENLLQVERWMMRMVKMVKMLKMVVVVW